MSVLANISNFFRRKNKVLKTVGVPPSTPTVLPQSTTSLESAAWAYSCMAANANAVADLAPVIERKIKQKWLVDDTPPPVLEDLIEFPSGVPYAGQLPSPPHWSWRELLYRAAFELQWQGSSYLVPYFGQFSGELLKLDPLLANDVFVDVDAVTDYPSQYITKYRTYQPNEIVHIREQNPADFHSGLAPWQVALKSIYTSAEARDRILWGLYNKAGIGMVIKHDGAWVDDDQRTKTLEYMANNYQKSQKTGMPLVVGAGTEVASPPQADAGIAAIESIRMPAMLEIFAVYGVPPSVVGIYSTEDSPGKSREQIQIHWHQNTVFPLARTVYESLNVQLIQPTYTRRTRLWYDLTNSQIGLLLLSHKADIAKKIVDIGYPANLAAKRVGMGMPDVEALNIPQQQLVEAGRIDAPKI